MPEEVDAGRIVASIALDSGALSKGAQEAAKKSLKTLIRFLPTMAKKADTAATVTQTTVTKGATGAQVELNTAMAANPIGLVAAALGSLIALLGTYSIMAGNASDETDKVVYGMKEMQEEAQKCTQAVRDLKSQKSEIISASEGEAAKLQALADQYDELRQEIVLTSDKKEHLNTIAGQIAEIMGVTTNELKDQSGAYKDLTKDIDEYLKKKKQEAKSQYYLDLISEAAKAEEKLKVEIDNIDKTIEKINNSELMSPGQKWALTANIWEPKKETFEQELKEAQDELKKAEDAYARFEKTLDESSEKTTSTGTAAGRAAGKITALGKAYESAADKAEELQESLTIENQNLEYRKSELRELRNQAGEYEKTLRKMKAYLDSGETELPKEYLDQYKDRSELAREYDRLLTSYENTLQDIGAKEADIFNVRQGISKIKDELKKAEEAAKPLDERLANLGKTGSSLRSEMTSLANSMKSLEQGEALSYNTLLDLIDKYPEYASELVNAAGNADLQKAALEKLFEAKKTEYILNQQAAIDEIEASNKATEAIIENIKNQIKAHLELQTVIVHGMRIPLPTGETLVDLVELNKYQQQLEKDKKLAEEIQSKIDFVSGLKIDDLGKSGKSSGSSGTDKEKDDLRKREVDSLSKIGDALTEAIKNRYAEQKKLEEQRIDESIENWQKWENETVSAVQGQIDALDELKNAQQEENRREEYEQKRQALELEMRYAKDDYNRKKIQKQIAVLDKDESERLYDLEIEERKKALQKEAENARIVSKEKQDALREQKTSISEKYNILMSDRALEGEARNMLLNSSSKEISDLIGTYAPNFDLLGTKLGERVYEAFKSRIGDVSGFADKITAAVDNNSGRAKAASELNAWSSLSDQRSRELEKNFSTEALKNKIVEILDKCSAPIKVVTEYKGMLAYTANSAADRFYSSSGGNIRTSSGGMAKTVNVYLTANFNGQVNSPVQVKRQLESVGQEIAKQIV